MDEEEERRVIGECETYQRFSTVGAKTELGSIESWMTIMGECVHFLAI
jgi:hypothetical protein